VVADRVEDLQNLIAQRWREPLGARFPGFRREWKSLPAEYHEISKRDVVEVISAIEQRGAPIAANKALKSIKTFLRWCVRRHDQSPAEGVHCPQRK
jgi:hypothetical protein